MNIKTKGFTLIELLVVIAIIGILSSVVLASLNSARNKGADAAIRSNLANTRPQAEIIYDETSSYATVCSNTTITSALNALKTASGATAANNIDMATAGAAATVTCHASSTAWAIEAPLKSSSGVFACVDYTGASATSSGSSLAANDAKCN